MFCKVYRKTSNQILQVTSVGCLKNSKWQNDKILATFINFVKFCGAYETKRFLVFSLHFFIEVNTTYIYKIVL